MGVDRGRFRMLAPYPRMPKGCYRYAACADWESEIGGKRFPNGDQITLDITSASGHRRPVRERFAAQSAVEGDFSSMRQICQLFTSLTLAPLFDRK